MSIIWLELVGQRKERFYGHQSLKRIGVAGKMRKVETTRQARVKIWMKANR